MANENNNTTAIHADPVVTTVRLPDEVWMAMKTGAARRRCSQNDIVVEALRQYLNLPEAN